MSHLQYMPGDPRLVDQLVYELKSKGIFDQFRKECIADVDTRPAYQNLRQRVESSVSSFLARQTWRPDLNKNQLREKLRKHILDGNYLEQGVERIVDQVVNPKVASVFIPQVEDLVFNYLGIPRKKPAESTTTCEKDNEDLLPTDLEAVSPGSVKSNEEKDKEEIIVVDEKMEVVDEKDDSVMFVEEVKADQETRLSGISELTINDSEVSMDKCNIPLPAEEIKLENIPAPENSPPNIKKENIDLEKINLPREPNLSTDIPLPDEIPTVPKIEKDNYFKPMILHSEDDDTMSDSDSSLRRNMSPLTPIRNFNNENSCDAQQGFENVSDDNKEQKQPSTFRFTIEGKSEENSADETKIDKVNENESQCHFSNKVDNTFNTPIDDDSSDSNHLQIDYESDVNSKATGEIKFPETENTEDSKKEKKDEKKSHKSSHGSKDSHRSSKDKRDSKSSRDSSRHDKKSKERDSKSHKEKSETDRKESKLKETEKDSKDYKHRSSSHKSSHKDSKHRSSSSSKHSSHRDDKKDDRKSSSSSKDKERSSRDKDRSSHSRSKSHRSDRDKKRSSNGEKENKDKKKEKPQTDDHYSLSGRGNHNRRSTDRDSNDGSSSSKSSQNPNGKTSESKEASKSTSKSATSTSSNSDSPSDREIIINQAKDVKIPKPIRVDNLDTPIAVHKRLPFVPDVTMKKPRFASNMEEAKRMMKMRKFLEEEQKRMNQEAALLLEFQANVRPSLSQVYSSVPGPELEFACINTEQPTTQVIANTAQTVEMEVNKNEIIVETVHTDTDTDTSFEISNDIIAETLIAMHREFGINKEQSVTIEYTVNNEEMTIEDMVEEKDIEHQDKKSMIETLTVINQEEPSPKDEGEKQYTVEELSESESQDSTVEVQKEKDIEDQDKKSMIETLTSINQEESAILDECEKQDTVEELNESESQDTVIELHVISENQDSVEKQDLPASQELSVIETNNDAIIEIQSPTRDTKINENRALDLEVTIIDEPISENEEYAKQSESVEQIAEYVLETEGVVVENIASVQDTEKSSVTLMIEDPELPADEIPLEFFVEQEQINSAIEKEKFGKFLQNFIEKTSTTKMFLINCDSNEENLIKDAAKTFGNFDIVTFNKNGHVKAPKTDKKVIKNVNVTTEVVLPTKSYIKPVSKYNSPIFNPSSKYNSPIFSPRSECSFELSSDYDAKLEEMVNKTSRKEIMEIILGGVIEETPMETEMPRLNFCSDSNIEKVAESSKSTIQDIDNTLEETIKSFTENIQNVSNSETEKETQELDSKNPEIQKETTVNSVGIDKERRYSAESGKRKIEDVECSNNNKVILAPNKLRRVSESDQITSTTQESDQLNKTVNRSKYLGKARRVGLSKPKKTAALISPSSDKSVENYSQNPATPVTKPNGKIKPVSRAKVQRYDTSDLYKPKLHYLSRRNNVT